MLFDNLETAKSHPAQLSGGNPFPSNLCFTPLEGLKTFCRGRIQCSPRDFGCGWGCGGALCPLAGWELLGPAREQKHPHLNPAELAPPAFYLDFWYIRTFGSVSAWEGGAAGMAAGSGNVL